MEYLRDHFKGENVKLRHHAAEGDTSGYDISYEDSSGQLQAIEVKGTAGSKFASPDLTDNELAAANKLMSNYTI